MTARAAATRIAGAASQVLSLLALLTSIQILTQLLHPRLTNCICRIDNAFNFVFYLFYHFFFSAYAVDLAMPLAEAGAPIRGGGGGGGGGVEEWREWGDAKRWQSYARSHYPLTAEERNSPAISVYQSANGSILVNNAPYTSEAAAAHAAARFTDDVERDSEGVHHMYVYVVIPPSLTLSLTHPPPPPPPPHTHAHPHIHITC